MADKIAVSAYRAAHLMLDAGMNEDETREALNNIQRPTIGYYYATDIMDRIRQHKKEGDK